MLFYFLWNTCQTLIEDEQKTIFNHIRLLECDPGKVCALFIVLAKKLATLLLPSFVLHQHHRQFIYRPQINSFDLNICLISLILAARKTEMKISLLKPALKLQVLRVDAKSNPSSYLQLLVIKCNCQTYNDYCVLFPLL